MQSQILKEIEKLLDGKLSYSDVSTFLSCPHKFKLLKIYNLKDSVKESKLVFDFGTAIHKILEKDFSEVKDLNIVVRDFRKEFIDIVNQNKDNYNPRFDQKVYDKLFESGKKIINDYFYVVKNEDTFLSHNHIANELEIIESFKTAVNEQLVTENISLLSFKGFIDKVFKNLKTNKITIVDFKTTGYGWSYNERKDNNKLMQLGFYKYFYAKKENVPLDDISTAYVFLKKNTNYAESAVEIFNVPFDMEKIKEIFKILDEVFNKIIMADFPKIKNKNNCKYCPFLNTKWCPSEELKNDG